MRKLLIIGFVLLILNGCATAYHPYGFAGGYSHISLGKNIFEVTFRGNGYTSVERAEDFVLLRSAEITLKNGFRYFVIDKSENTPRSFMLPATTATDTIQCFKEEPKINGLVYNAELVSKSIKTKYELTK